MGEGIDIEFSEKASEKTQEECKPGTPFIVFRVDPSINLTFVNDQPHTGLFTITCPIMENDTCKKIALRLSRTEKKVKLLRYADSNLGPRKMPSSENIDDGKIEILSDEFTFKINLESNQVNLYKGQKAETIELGNAIVYRI